MQNCRFAARAWDRRGRQFYAVGIACRGFALDVGLLPLTGAADAEHMGEDLAVLDYHWEPGEIEQVENVAGP